MEDGQLAYHMKKTTQPNSLSTPPLCLLFLDPPFILCAHLVLYVVMGSNLFQNTTLGASNIRYHRYNIGDLNHQILGKIVRRTWVSTNSG